MHTNLQTTGGQIPIPETGQVLKQGNGEGEQGKLLTNTTEIQEYGPTSQHIVPKMPETKPVLLIKGLKSNNFSAEHLEIQTYRDLALLIVPISILLLCWLAPILLKVTFLMHLFGL